MCNPSIDEVNFEIGSSEYLSFGHSCLPAPVPTEGGACRGIYLSFACLPEVPLAGRRGGTWGLMVLQ
jgi:hypothetical protein